MLVRASTVSPSSESRGNRRRFEACTRVRYVFLTRRCSSETPRPVRAAADTAQSSTPDVPTPRRCDGDGTATGTVAATVAAVAAGTAGREAGRLVSCAAVCSAMAAAGGRAAGASGVREPDREDAASIDAAVVDVGAGGEAEVGSQVSAEVECVLVTRRSGWSFRESS
eukprot:6197403-Pleurochrysis_carterae.AAC.1